MHKKNQMAIFDGNGGGGGDGGHMIIIYQSAMSS